MNWLRIGGWTILALVLLWVVFQIVSVILSFVSWIISTVLTLLVVGILLYLAYLAVSKFMGNDSTTTTSREKLYE